MNENTTYDPKKQNAVQYQLGEHRSTIVVSDVRNNLGHELIRALSETGTDVNDLVDEDNKPKKVLLDAISEMVKQNAFLFSKQRKSLHGAISVATEDKKKTARALV